MLRSGGRMQPLAWAHLQAELNPEGARELRLRHADGEERLPRQR